MIKPIPHLGSKKPTLEDLPSWNAKIAGRAYWEGLTDVATRLSRSVLVSKLLDLRHNNQYIIGDYLSGFERLATPGAL